MQLDALQDQPLVPAGRPSRRHLVLRLEAPAAEKPAERPQLDLAVVVDRSGSMDGFPLACALEGASRLPGLLHQDDRLAVVDFGSDIRVTLPPARMDERGRSRAEAALRSIQCHGCTDLHGGWRTGAETLECLPRRNGDAGRDARVLVLSDGMGNRGITHPPHLAVEAAAMRGRGVLTTTVGVGNRYSTEQLEALAFHGGGRMHRASDPEQLIGLLAEELQEVRATVAEMLLADLSAPGGVRMRCLSACPEDHPGRWAAGALVAGQKRDLVFQLDLPLLPAGESLEVGFSVSWCPPGSASREFLVGMAAFTAVAGDDPRLENWNTEAAAIVAQAWQSSLVREGAFAHERGNHRAACAVLRAAEPELREYLKLLPEPLAWELLREVEDLIQQSRRSVLPQRHSKELLMMKAKRMRGERDLRWRRRSWTEIGPPDLPPQDHDDD